MNDLLFKNPETQEWNSMFEDYRDVLYPVGSVILSADDDFNPSETIGGSWNKITYNGYLRFANTKSTASTGGDWNHKHRDAFGWEAPDSKSIRFWGWRGAEGFSSFGTEVVTGTHHWSYRIVNGDFEMTSIASGPTRLNYVETVSTEPPYMALAAWQRVA